MTRYFFDVLDADGAFRDELGIELENMDAAVAEARRALADMVSDALKGQDAAHVEIRIRDGSEGPILLAVTMQMHDENTD